MFLKVASCLLVTICLFGLQPVQAEDPFKENTLRVGFHRPSFHEYSREDLEVSVKLLTEEMGKDIGIQTSVAIYDDIQVMRAEFERGIINIVFASPLLLATKFDISSLNDGFKMVPQGGSTDSLVILSRRYEGMDNFKDLKGKKLGLVDNDPISELYVNFLSLSTFHKDFKYIFNEIPREKKSHQIILKLFFGQADLVCVYGSFYKLTADLNPQILSKTQVIAKMDGILQGAGFFHKNVDSVFREAIIKEVIKLNTYPRGRQFLEIFKTERAERISVADLASSKKLYDNYSALKNGK